MNISIVGTGYLGLTTAAVLASAGHKVYCIDINPSVIESVKKGQSHFYEPGLDELVKKQVLETKRLIPTLDYSEAIPDSAVSFICVDTPSDENGELSTKAVKAASKTVAENMQDNHIIVLKSTVPVGTAVEVKEVISNTTSKSFTYVSNPEFLSEGASVIMTLLPDHLIIGAENENGFKTIFDIFKQVDDYAKENADLNLNSINETYRSKFDFEKPYEERVVRTSIESAELIKMTANSFLAMKISFANSIARIADKTGANVKEVMKGIGADPRIGTDFLYAGLGWGGGCFPKDIKGLISNAKKVGFDFGLLKETEKINYDQIEYSKKKIIEMVGGDLRKKTVTVLGLAFKPGTNDIRISPALSLVETLSKEFKQIRVYDPKANDNAKEYLKSLPNINYSDSIEDAFVGSSIGILATDWPEFMHLNLELIRSKMKETKLFDARNKWNREEIELADFEYQGIGV